MLAGAGQGSTVAIRQQARERYEALLKDDLFDRAKQLRKRRGYAQHRFRIPRRPKFHYGGRL